MALELFPKMFRRWRRAHRLNGWPKMATNATAPLIFFFFAPHAQVQGHVAMSQCFVFSLSFTTFSSATSSMLMWNCWVIFQQSPRLDFYQGKAGIVQWLMTICTMICNRVLMHSLVALCCHTGRSWFICLHPCHRWRVSSTRVLMLSRIMPTPGGLREVTKKNFYQNQVSP